MKKSRKGKKMKRLAQRGWLHQLDGLGDVLRARGAETDARLRERYAKKTR